MATSFEAYTRQDGSIDWHRYDAARKANGELCQRCGACIAENLIRTPGRPDVCRACRRLENDRVAVEHESKIRCPKCRRIWSGDGVEEDLYTKGEHNVGCDCGHVFTVETQVIYKFRSPPLASNEGDAGADD